MKHVCLVFEVFVCELVFLYSTLFKKSCIFCHFSITIPISDRFKNYFEYILFSSNIAHRIKSAVAQFVEGQTVN